VPARTQLHRLVTEYRERRYPYREKAKRLSPRDKSAKEKWEPDPGGLGFEIVREIGICPECAKTHPRALPPYQKPPKQRSLPKRKRRKKQKHDASPWDRQQMAP